MMAQLWHHHGALESPNTNLGGSTKIGDPALDVPEKYEETHVL
jgi:hypothetical protein